MSKTHIEEKQYLPKVLEEKWQKLWEESGIYSFNESSSKPNYYSLVMFPYPSGNLHLTFRTLRAPNHKNVSNAVVEYRQEFWRQA